MVQLSAEIFYEILMYGGVGQDDMMTLWTECRGFSRAFKDAVERVFIGRHLDKTSLLINAGVLPQFLHLAQAEPVRQVYALTPMVGKSTSREPISHSLTSTQKIVLVPYFRLRRAVLRVESNSSPKGLPRCSTMKIARVLRRSSSAFAALLMTRMFLSGKLTGAHCR